MGKAEKYTNADIRVFAEAYVRTGNATESYRTMRPNSKASGQTAARNGCTLTKDPRFIKAIQSAAMRNDVTECITKSRLNHVLTNFIETCARRDEVDKASKLIDIVCKMNGFYEAQKLEVRTGAIDAENRDRALAALQAAGREVIDVKAVEHPAEVALLGASEAEVARGEHVTLRDLPMLEGTDRGGEVGKPRLEDSFKGRMRARMDEVRPKWEDTTGGLLV